MSEKSILHDRSVIYSAVNVFFFFYYSGTALTVDLLISQSDYGRSTSIRRITQRCNGANASRRDNTAGNRFVLVLYRARRALLPQLRPGHLHFSRERSHKHRGFNRIYDRVHDRHLVQDLQRSQRHDHEGIQLLKARAVPTYRFYLWYGDLHWYPPLLLHGEDGPEMDDRKGQD
eukprot:m.327694 g.327694  ORF g.327694 m.327694 type:complete len:174 (-) comp27683_c0_seq14:264-785(-)